MNTTDEIDLEGERQKLTEKLTLVVEAIKQENQVQGDKETLSKAQNDIQSLTVTLSALNIEVEQLEAEHEANLKNHHVKKAEWLEKNPRKESIIFGSEDGASISSDDEDDIDERTELAQENLNLLIQLGNIKKLSKSIRGKTAEVKTLNEKISASQILVSKAAPSVHSFTLVLDKVKLTCLPSRELSAAHDEIQTKATEILQLEQSKSKLAESIQALTKQVQGLQGELAVQMKINDDQHGTITLLTTPLPSLEQLVKDKTETIASNMKIAYQAGRSAQHREMVGLYTAGCAIRSRKLVWFGQIKDPKIDVLGNKASHYGMALADASLYQDTCPTEYRRSDTAVFELLYGVSPIFVWDFQDCKKLLDILDWRGAMKDFYVHGYGSYDSSTFNSLFRKLFFPIKTHPDTWTTDYCIKHFESEEGKKMYESFQGQYEAGLARHNDYLKKR